MHLTTRHEASRATGPAFHSSVSVFFPAYNDAPSLPELLRRTLETLEQHVADYEVIVVNDGSFDNTAEVLADLQRLYGSRLRIITHPRNLGYGSALRSGFLAATKDYIFYTDGDGQYDPRELESLLQAAEPGVALVNGYKTSRSDPWHRIAIGWLYNQFARTLFRIRLRDIDCDFRLIRRDAFDPAALRSTGGTICVELVRQIELTGKPVVQLPVSHYARQHGRSQFFRVRSLAITFSQLCQLYARLVVRPAIGAPATRSWFVTMALLVAALSTFAYARSLSLPFIADDYIQLQLGRDYGPVSKWSSLAQDVLYRSRATSILLTHWIESVFGMDPLPYRLAALAMHILNGLLVLAFGAWPVIGWRTAAFAAAFFAFSQRHSEAVIWFAASPELLVFFFSDLSVLAWIAALRSDRRAWLWWALSLASFALALLSKESAVAVVPILLLVAILEKRTSLTKLAGIAPFAALSALYFQSIYAARATHLHFNDGTFSLNAPFLEVLLRSAGGLLWPWGLIAISAMLLLKLRPDRRFLTAAALWLVFALLPYSFIAYMPRVPSRHTYLASVGLAWLVGAAFLAFRETPFAARRFWLPPAIAVIAILHEGGYISTVLHSRYLQRAQPTVELLGAAQTTDTVRARCFPYSPYVASYALRIAYPDRPALRLDHSPEAAKHEAALDFCNSTVEGTRY